MHQFASLVDKDGNFIGIKMTNGKEVRLAQLAEDSLTLLTPSGQAFNPATSTVQKASPTSGATVQMSNDSMDGALYINPAATLASLTVNLPTNLTSRDGQIRRIVTSKAITSLTIGGATILSTVTELSAGDSVSFMKVDNNTWSKL